MQKTARYEALKESPINPTALFILETPLWVGVSLISGMALAIFKSAFAAPFLIIAISAVSTRLALKGIKHYNPQQIKNFKEKISLFRQNNSFMNYSVVLPFVLIKILPLASIIIALGIGIYKGTTLEMDVFKKRQNILRSHSNLNDLPAIVQII